MTKNIIKIVDLEKVFYHVAKDLPSKKSLVRQEFLAEIRILAEEWIDNKFRLMGPEWKD